MIYLKYLSRKTSYLLMGVLSAISVACNKNNNATLTSAKNSATTSSLQQKVLFVVVDGAMGTEMQAVTPPVLTGLTNHAIFSWNSLTDYTDDSVTNPSTWTTLLTGVNNDKHQVSDNLGTVDLADYPTMFTRLKTSNSKLRTIGIASVDSFKTALLGDATLASSFGGDDAAANAAALSEIKTNDPDLLMVEFNSVDAAGRSSSYSASSSSYKSALLQVDTYIGQLITAIQGRANYANENWLIILTSNKGSNTGIAGGAAWSAFDDPRHNTFTFYYNPRFVPKVTAKPVGILPYGGRTQSYTISGSSDPGNQAIVPASTLGTRMDFGAGSEFSVQCKVKFSSTTNYPSFLGKMQKFDDGNPTPGFLFFQESGNWQFTVRPIGGSRTQVMGGAVNDGGWHTLTGVVRIESGKRKIMVFTDGVKGAVKDIGMSDSYINAENFMVGWRTGSNGGSLTGLITDVRVYGTALSDAYVAANYCSTTISPNDTAYSKLVGFWPSADVQTDGSKYWFSDMGPNNINLNILKANLASFNDKSTNICPPVSVASYVSVPNNVDAFPLIFSWFNLPVSASWNLDGQTWVPNYNDIIN
ncbi:MULTISPECIES: LamG-like jellyroll fold domain-containing protein [Chitinophagaceae]